MAPILILILPSTADQSSIVQLEVGETLRIGRSQVEPSPGFKVARMAFPEVSGKHAEIHCRESELVIVDLGSTNGTTVNGKPCASGVEYFLRHGDQVRIAGYYLIAIDAPDYPNKAEQVEFSDSSDEDQFARQLKMKAMPVVELADFDENYVSVGDEASGDDSLGVETVVVEPFVVESPPEDKP